MRIPHINFSRRGRIILAVAIVLIWIVVHQQISQMDGRFFQPSISGMKGLALYLAGDYSGAAKAYRAHFQELYRTERTAADPGWDALLRGDLQAAEEISWKELESDPAAIDPLLTLGEIALEKDALDQALGILDRILQRAPYQFDALLLTSVVQARSGAYGEAIDSLNGALRTDRLESRITSFLQALKTTGDLARLPKGARPLCLLAHYHRYLRIFDPSNTRIALSHAKQAIKSGDRPADAFLTIGIVYRKEGKPKRALHALLQAIELNPKHAEAHRRAAQIYSDRGDLPNEYRMRKAAFEIAPEDPFHTNAFTFFLREKLGDYHQAVAVTQKALEANPDDLETLNQAGEIYRFLGEPERALAYHRKALSLDPRNPDLHHAIGADLGEQRRHEEAIAAYRTALSIDPSRTLSRLSLAWNYGRLQHHREAIAELEEVLRRGKLDVRFLIGLCSNYANVAEFERAEDCFRRVLAEDAANVTAKRWLQAIQRNPRHKESRP